METGRIKKPRHPWWVSGHARSGVTRSRSGVLEHPRPDIEEQVGHLVFVRRAVHPAKRKGHLNHATRPPDQQ